MCASWWTRSGLSRRATTTPRSRSCGLPRRNPSSKKSSVSLHVFLTWDTSCCTAPLDAPREYSPVLQWAGFLGLGSSESHASLSLNATYLMTNHREYDASASHYPSSCTLPPIEDDPLVQCGTANIPDNRESIFCRRTSCETNG